MNWIILTFLAVLSRSVYSIATKLLSNKVKVSSIAQSVLLTTFGGILCIPISFLFGGINFSGISTVWPIVLLSVCSQAFGNVLFFIGITELDAGTTQIAFSSIIIWGTLLSVLFLGSKFSGFQLLGILLMLLAILLTQYAKRKINFNRGALFIIASAALFAIFQVTSAKISTIVSTGAYLLLSYLGSSLIISVFYFKRIAKDIPMLVKNVQNVLSTTLFASGTSLLYFIFSFFAYRVAPDKGVVVILLTSQVILSVILGILFLRERQNLKIKLLAGILAFVAAVLIKS